MSDNDPAQLIGKTIAGRYRVVAFIGLGSTLPGAVYEADDRGRPVALKVLLPAQGDAAARFAREVKTLGLLSHANIVQLVDTGTLDDGTLYLVTELVRGATLREVLDQGPLEPRRALAIELQILEALGHAHGVGVVHRDLKPENIMLGDGDAVKLVDFGVAKLVGDTLALLGDTKLTQTGTSLLGAPLYTAPEAVSGGTVDARSDLYAAGAILYEMIAGKPPFAAANAAAVMAMHQTAEVPKLGLPAIDLLIGEAMAKQPALRFPSAVEMISAARTALLSLEPVPSMMWPAPSGPAPQTPLTAHLSPPLLTPEMRRKVLIGGGATLGGILVIAVVASHCGGKKDQAPAPVAKTSDATKQAADLLSRGDAQGAADFLDLSLASPQAPSDAHAYLLLGRARMQLGRRTDGVLAYERAIELDKSLASDAQLRTDVTRVLERPDPVAGVLAIELLAALDPPAKDTIVAQAGTGKLPEVRHRAFALAERLGAAAEVDRIESWSLDLRQASTCDERRTAVLHLRGSGDKRALPALKKAQSQFACVAKDAGDAVQYLTSLP